MSRLARQPIAIANGLSVKEEGGSVLVKGPKGELRLPLLPFTTVKTDADGVRVETQATTKQAISNTGTMWSHIKNALIGVSDGFSKLLELEGVGYKAALEGKTLVLSLGFSQPVRYTAPEEITITVDKTGITVSGTDKTMVGQTAAEIRSFRKPEPYKGKGIHYKGEVIRRKVGKKAAAAAG